MSRENHAMFEWDLKKFLKHFVTRNGFTTWNMRQNKSKQWKHPGSPLSKKAKSTTSAGKVMATVFWDAKDVLSVDYLERGHTMTRGYYADLMRQFCEKIGRQGMASCH